MTVGAAIPDSSSAIRITVGQALKKENIFMGCQKFVQILINLICIEMAIESLHPLVRRWSRRVAGHGASKLPSVCRRGIVKFQIIEIEMPPSADGFINEADIDH